MLHHRLKLAAVRLHLCILSPSLIACSRTFINSHVSNKPVTKSSSTANNDGTRGTLPSLVIALTMPAIQQHGEFLQYRAAASMHGKTVVTASTRVKAASSRLRMRSLLGISFSIAN
ncbi:hypothetical protein BDZ97DRAFT_1894355 [Flammula alnicola]|nr:hypothetical protein BDZ97DRAFT_1894355 [Flammula alnicola]